MMAQADSEQALYTGLPALVVPLVVVLLWAIAVGNWVMLGLAGVALAIWVVGAYRLTRGELVIDLEARRTTRRR